MGNIPVSRCKADALATAPIALPTAKSFARPVREGQPTKWETKRKYELTNSGKKSERFRILKSGNQESTFFPEGGAPRLLVLARKFERSQGFLELGPPIHELT